MPVNRVAIVGGGIAGLTAALAFARHGVAVRVIEKSHRLEEVGAGLQLSPNVTRILSDLGLLDPLRSRWLEPEVVALASGLTLKRLTALPIATLSRQRWGSPYGVLHRATLQQVLVEAVRANPLCDFVLGEAVESPVAAILRDPHLGMAPDLVIGADGVWSGLRSCVAGAPTVTFSGNVAWRTTLSAADAPDLIDRHAVTAFLGPKAHLVAYPLQEAGRINIVAIGAGFQREGERLGKAWAKPAQASEAAALEQAFAAWHGDIRALLASAPQPTVWPLFETSQGRWQNGRDLVLIGDAAHAMMPFSAQGAAMAIEDAHVLAACVRAYPLPDALQHFERLRQPRIKRLRRRGALNQFVYHVTGPVRAARDLAFALRPAEAFARDLDWLYGYRLDADGV